MERTKRRHRPLTFSQIADMCRHSWEEKHLLKQIRARTLQGYLEQLALAERVFGKRLTFEISPKDIKDYRLQLVKDHSAVTANRRLFILKQVFSLALKEGAIREDPTEGVAYLSEESHKCRRFLLPADIDKVLEACASTKAIHLQPIILLSVEHAAAKQEILDLRWENIDFEQNIIRFYRTKNGMERIQKLMPRTREALLAWQAHQAEARRRKRIGKVEADLVFGHLDGRPRKDFKSAWQRVRKLAGIKDYHFHDNRHTFCSSIVNVGGSLKDVMEMIGHRDMRSANRYSHLEKGRVADIQQRVSDLYGRAVGDDEE